MRDHTPTESPPPALTQLALAGVTLIVFAVTLAVYIAHLPVIA